MPLLDGPYEVPAPRDTPIFGERGWLVSDFPGLQEDLKKARETLRKHDEAEVRRLQKSWKGA